MRPEIPDPIVNDIDEIINDGPFQSRGEFVRDALRHQIEQYNNSNLKNNSIPFDSNGIKMGTDIHSENPLVIDRFNSGYHSLTLGTTGTGSTTTTTKIELLREFRGRDDLQVFVISSCGEYNDIENMVSRSKRVHCSEKFTLNPFSMYPENSTGEAISSAVEFLKRYFEVYVSELDADVENVLMVAVENTYNNTNIESVTVEDIIEELGKIGGNPSKYHNEFDEQNSVGMNASYLMFHLNNEKYRHFIGEANNSITDDEKLTIFDLYNTEYDSDKMMLLYHGLINKITNYSKQTDKKTMIVIDDMRHITDLDWLTTEISHARSYDISYSLVTHYQNLINYSMETNVRSLISTIGLIRCNKLINSNSKKIDELLPHNVINGIQTLGINDQSESIYHVNEKVFKLKNDGDETHFLNV